MYSSNLITTTITVTLTKHYLLTLLVLAYMLQLILTFTLDNFAMFHVMFDCCSCPVDSMLVAYPMDSGVRIKVNINQKFTAVVSMLAAFASLCTATVTKQYQKVKHARIFLLNML